MKLFTDEESDFMCRDSRPIPMEIREQIFNVIINDDHISKFNPIRKMKDRKMKDKKGRGGGGGDDKKKRSYHTPTNIIVFCEAVCAREGVEPVEYMKEYNKIYDNFVKKRLTKVEELEMEEESYRYPFEDYDMDDEGQEIITTRDTVSSSMIFNRRPAGKAPKDINGNSKVWNELTSEWEIDIKLRQDGDTVTRDYSQFEREEDNTMQDIERMGDL